MRGPSAFTRHPTGDPRRRGAPLPSGSRLRKNQLLAGLSPEAIELFVEYTELRTVERDTVVIEQGARGDEFFIAEKGGFNFSVGGSAPMPLQEESFGELVRRPRRRPRRWPALLPLFRTAYASAPSPSFCVAPCVTDAPFAPPAACLGPPTAGPALQRSAQRDHHGLHGRAALGAGPRDLPHRRARLGRQAPRRDRQGP